MERRESRGAPQPTTAMVQRSTPMHSGAIWGGCLQSGSSYPRLPPTREQISEKVVQDHETFEGAHGQNEGALFTNVCYLAGSGRLREPTL